MTPEKKEASYRKTGDGSVGIRLINKDILVHSRGNTDIIDITSDVQSVLAKSGMSDGSVLLFVRGSTATLTTVEYEPNLVKDLKEAFDRLVPSNINYDHSKTWGDFNGHSHVRASLMGPSLQVPFVGGKLQLGTWQQIILIDFDTSPRHRNILAQLTGA